MSQIRRTSEAITPKYSRLQDWIADLGSKEAVRPDGVKVKLYKVEPYMVEAIHLVNTNCRINSLNLKGRPLDPKAVKSISDDILEGKWNEFADPIKYIHDSTSELDGVLVSGQHRLYAISKYKKAVSFSCSDA
jgi:hypothetical protein